MKLSLPTLLCVSAFAFSAMGFNASAQDIKIAVVDMQEALNSFYKTEIEVEKINAMAEEKRKSIDDRQVKYQQMTAKMTELDKTVRDTILPEAKRKTAMEELQALAQERAQNGEEIRDAQRKASSEVLAARSEMESKLVTEIKEAVDSIVKSQGHDLVFDKSFLPKANKAILYTSDNVKDLTEEVVAFLNAGAPAKEASGE